MTKLQVPMWARSSDIRKLAMSDGCELGWLLPFLYPDEVMDTLWFITGTSVHGGAELAITKDLTLDETQHEAWLIYVNESRKAKKKGGILESVAKNRKRSLETVLDDIERMVEKFHRNFMPGDSQDPRLKDYAWPPIVEHVIEETTLNVNTKCDLLFIEGKRNPELIVDLKTGSTKKANPAQLHHYEWGFRRLGMVTPDREKLGAFYHVDHEHWQDVYEYWGDTTVTQQIARMHSVKGDIIHQGLVSASPDWWCGYCQAKDLCPIEGKGDWDDIRARIDEAEMVLNPSVWEE